MSQKLNQEVLLAEIKEWNQHRVTKLFRDVLLKDVERLQQGLVSEDLLVSDVSGKRAAQILGRIQATYEISQLNLETLVRVEDEEEVQSEDE